MKLTRPCPVLLMSRSFGLGGSERQTAAVARALDRGEFSPRIGCFRPEGMRIAELERDGVPVIPFAFQSFRSLRALRAARVFLQYVRRESIRVIHTFDFPTTLFVAPLKPFLCDTLFISSQRSHRELNSSGTRRLLRCSDRAADAIIVNCDWVRQHMIIDEGVPARKLELCYNGIDTAEFFPGAEVRPSPLPPGKVVIGVVCGLRPEKDLGTLLRAFATIPASDNACLVLVGGGSEREALGALAQQLGLGERIHFIDATVEVSRWLRSMDIFVLPSVSEALSNSLMEAMACGCCPVASQVGGNPELVEDGITGRLFPARDVARLGAILRELLADSAQRQHLAQAAATRIAGHFGLRDSAHSMGTIYTRLLNRAII